MTSETKTVPARAQSIREFLDNAPVKAFHAHVLEGCRKHGISLDSPWPPKFPEEGEAEQQTATMQIVQLDSWEDGKRAVPNAVVRSALFPALGSQKRQFIKEKTLCSVQGVTVIFTGEQFDQSDLDVYLEILNMACPFPLGTPVRFSAYAMLKALGRNTGKTDHEWLHSVLIRLRGGTVDMTDHKVRYFGGLIEGGIKDEITRHYEIVINPQFAVLFGFGMWATIDRDQRCALGRNQLLPGRRWQKRPQRCFCCLPEGFRQLPIPGSA